MSYNRKRLLQEHTYYLVCYEQWYNIREERTMREFTRNQINARGFDAMWPCHWYEKEEIEAELAVLALIDFEVGVV
jgi:hypothetical protein